MLRYDKVNRRKRGRLSLILVLILTIDSASGLTCEAASLQTGTLTAAGKLCLGQAAAGGYAGSSKKRIGIVKEAFAQAQDKVQTFSDRRLLASLIFCEAGNQSFDGQTAVGAVVLNRMRSSRYPDTMEEVIYQPGQFIPAGNGWLDRVIKNSGSTETAMRAADAALDGANPIGNCLYFDQGGYGLKIGAHYFH